MTINVGPFLFIAFVILLIIKLCGVDISWLVVCIPLLIPVFVIAIWVIIAIFITIIGIILNIFG